jgi:hypothetical protein
MVGRHGEPSGGVCAPGVGGGAAVGGGAWPPSAPVSAAAMRSAADSALHPVVVPPSYASPCEGRHRTADQAVKGHHNATDAYSPSVGCGAAAGYCTWSLSTVAAVGDALEDARGGPGGGAVIGCSTRTPSTTAGAGDAWVAAGAYAPCPFASPLGCASPHGGPRSHPLRHGDRVCYRHLGWRTQRLQRRCLGTRVCGHP